jgi:hypothetical protein
MRLKSKLLAMTMSGVALLGLAGAAAVTAGNAYADDGASSGSPVGPAPEVVSDRRILHLLNGDAVIANMCIDNNTQRSFWHCTGNKAITGGGDVDFPYKPGDSITFVALPVGGSRSAIDVPPEATRCELLFSADRMRCVA